MIGEYYPFPCTVAELGADVAIVVAGRALTENMDKISMRCVMTLEGHSKCQGVLMGLRRRRIRSSDSGDESVAHRDALNERGL